MTAQRFRWFIFSLFLLVTAGCLPDRTADLDKRMARFSYLEEFNQFETVKVIVDDSEMQVTRIFFPEINQPAMVGLAQPMPACRLEFYSGVRFWARSLDRPVDLSLSISTSAGDKLLMDVYQYKPDIHLTPGEWTKVEVDLNEFHAASIENKPEIVRLPKNLMSEWNLNLTVITDSMSPVTVDWGAVTLYREGRKFKFE